MHIKRALIWTYIYVVLVGADNEIGNHRGVLRRIKGSVHLIAYVSEFGTVPRPSIEVKVLPVTTAAS